MPPLPPIPVDCYKMNRILGGVRYGSPYKNIRHIRYAMESNQYRTATIYMNLAINYALQRGNANVEIGVDGDVRTFADWVDELRNMLPPV